MRKEPDDRQEAGLRIDICVCTYRRQKLEDTLLSLGALAVPGSATVRIIVADNDHEPSAREGVMRLRAQLPFDVLYVHCPASNISIARNACLDNSTADLLAFVDDDETVSREWLVELCRTLDETGADAVLGPVEAVYREDAPRWMRRGGFHSTAPVWVKGEIRTGYSCNALIRRTSPRLAGRRFNLALGRTGGEDTEYFARLHQSGGTIAFTPRAVVFEPVPGDRARFSWLAKRRFRMGQTHGRLLGERNSGVGLLRQVCLAMAKVAYCAVATAACATSARQRNRYALRAILHAGAVGGLLGVREIRQYGDAGRHGNAA